MAKHLGRKFPTIVRSTEALRKVIESDPYRKFRLPVKAKRVVTFMRTASKAKLKLPLEMDGARILAMKGGEVFTAYVPTGRGAAFMVLIEKTLGRDVTTRTWETVKKCTTA